MIRKICPVLCISAFIDESSRRVKCNRTINVSLPFEYKIFSDTQQGNGDRNHALSRMREKITVKIFSYLSCSLISFIAGPQSAFKSLVFLPPDNGKIKSLCVDALKAVPPERFERNLAKFLLSPNTSIVRYSIWAYTTISFLAVPQSHTKRCKGSFRVRLRVP